MKLARCSNNIVFNVLILTVAALDGSCTSSGSGARSLIDQNTATSTVTNGCTLYSRDTSSCQSAREELGLSGNWLSFSCNVVLGLADSGGNPTTNSANATYVTLTSSGLPDYTSNYYTASGSYSFTAYDYTVTGLYSALYAAFSPSFPDPNAVKQQSAVMSVPLNPVSAAAKTQQMNMGVVGMAINGVLIYDSVAGNTDNIFAEAGSFDRCGGHADNSNTYHYHGEPHAISYQDNHLIGVMRDGFFIYGRNDNNGQAPGSEANLETAGSSSDIYVYGGHNEVDPVTGTGTSFFHYHLVEWTGCYHETMPGQHSADDGETQDPNTKFNSNAGSCSGTWEDTWFMSGRGNGGVYNTIPSGLSGQSPSQTQTAVRYYYGTPGSCSGCF